MNTNNEAAPDTAQNSSENTETKATGFDYTDLTDIVRNKILGGEESTDVKESDGESENPAEQEATAEQESEVHSQQPEDATESETEDEDTEQSETESEDDAQRGLPKGVKKRIDKLIAKRREAETEVERLRAEMERLEQEANKPAQTPTKSNPYTNLSTAEAVQKEIEQAKQIRRWCEMNPDGAIITDANGNEQEYSAEEVRNIKIKALDALEEHLPARLNYLQNYQQAEQVVNKEYPWWKDKSAQERQIAEAFVKHFPEITKFPDYKMVVGDYIRGVKAREQSQKKTSVVPKAPSQPRTTSAPSSISQKDAKAQVAGQRFVQSGNRDDLSAIIASKFL